MAAFESLADALDYLGKECRVISTGESGLLCSIQAEGSRLECPFGFYRDMSDVEPVPAVVSIALTLTPASIAVDGTSEASVVATYDDGSTATVSATIESGTPATASVEGSTLTGLAAGTSSITASWAGKSDSKTLTVTT